MTSGRAATNTLREATWEIAGPDTPAAHSFERKLMGYVGGDDDTSEWYGTCSCGWRGPLREDVDAPLEDWVRAHADLTGGVECDACGSPATRYDLDGQWCDVHDRTSACMDCGELDCPGPRLPANGPDTPADSQPYTTQARTIDPLAALRDDSQPEEGT